MLLTVSSKEMKNSKRLPYLKRVPEEWAFVTVAFRDLLTELVDLSELNCVDRFDLDAPTLLTLLLKLHKY